MTQPLENKPNPKGARRRTHRRRFYGLTDEQQRDVLQRQRAAIVAVFDAMEDYFCADLDARLESLDAIIRTQIPEEIDAEFTEAE